MTTYYHPSREQAHCAGVINTQTVKTVHCLLILVGAKEQIFNQQEKVVFFNVEIKTTAEKKLDS